MLKNSTIRIIKAIQRKEWVFQYGRYFLIGSVVGITAIILREVLAAIAPVDTPFFYILSVVMVYCFGIMLSFLMHRSFTFRVSKERRKWNIFGSFFLVASYGAISTTLLALFFRYWCNFDELFGKLAPGISFATATFISSITTYLLNSRLVFKERKG